MPCGGGHTGPAYADAVRLLPILFASLLCGLLSDASAGATPDFEAMTGEFVTSSLALSPVTATAQGYHRHQGAVLDGELDDFSPAGIERRLQFYRDWEQRLDRLDAAALDAEQQADLQIIRNAVGLALLDLHTIQTWRHDPTVYVELIQQALIEPLKVDYAADDIRFGHIIERLRKVPRLLEQAQANLSSAPQAWIQAARDQNARNFRLIDQLLRAQVPAAQAADYDAAAAAALEALREFDRFVAQDLSRHPYSWRLGRALYGEKCGYELAVARTPEQLLQSAAADLQVTLEQMGRLAAPLSVPQALNRVARRHSTPDQYVAQARLSLQQATEFVRASGLVALPSQRQVEVMETPEFMRGIYPVGGFDPAPAMEPQRGAVYRVTPIPAAWPRERVESQLREYNDFGLQQLTIHEAMPGHWVQADYANRIRPAPRRAVRALYGSATTVEGWAVYAQQMMVDEGYLGGDGGLRLTLLKQLLQSITDTILDIELQTTAMTDREALDFMIEDALQQPQEAAARLLRSKLSSCRQASRYAGFKGWLALRDEYRQGHAADYTLSRFNERALGEGAVPLPALARLLH
jgi:uncharacterized protein (DUF885 family)